MTAPLQTNRRFNARLDYLLAVWLLCSLVPYWILSATNYGAATAQVKTPMGTLYTQDHYQAAVLNDTIDYIVRKIPQECTLVVVPEGIGINALTQRPNPLRYYYFTPPGLAIIGEDAIISAFRSARVDYILLVQRTTAEYGPEVFGIDYGAKLDKWIKDNYELAAQFGPYPFTTEKFGTALFKRKAAGHALP